MWLNVIVVVWPVFPSYSSQIYSELREEEMEIQSQAVKLECSLKGVIREAFLESVISEAHWLSLHHGHCPAVHVSHKTKQTQRKYVLDLWTLCV